MAKFLKADISQVDPYQLREHEINVFGAYGNLLEVIEKLFKISDAYCLMIDDEVISFAGIKPIWAGVGDIWQMPTINVSKHLVTYCKCTNLLLDQWWGKYALHRMQTICLDDRIHNRWHKFLKFHKEGTLKHYGMGGEDYALFARY